jgi:hypothetical protein
MRYSLPADVDRVRQWRHLVHDMKELFRHRQIALALDTRRLRGLARAGAVMPQEDGPVLQQ